MSYANKGLMSSDTDLFLKEKGHSFVGYKGIIHTVDDDIEVIYTVSIDFVSDFVGAYADRLVYKAVVAHSDWIKKILPNRANLELTIIRTYPEGVTHQRYKAVIPNHTLKDIAVDQLAKLNDFDLNNHQVGLCEVQGKYLQVEPLPTLTVSGNFRQLKVDQLMSQLIKGTTQAVTVRGGQIIDEVIILPPQKQQTLSQLNIPAGTPLLQLPAYIQKECGVYTQGLGSYIRPFEDGKVTWWIYSLYDTTRWDTSNARLAISLGNSTLNNLLPVTYQRDGKSLIIPGVYPSEQSEGVDTRAPLRATGVKVIDTDRVIEKPFKYDKTGLYTAKGGLYHDVDVYKHHDGVDYSEPTVYRTSNYYQATSAAAYNQMIPMAILWNNSDHTLLIPAMPVRIYIDKGSYMEQVDGVLTGYQSSVDRVGSGTGNNRYTERTLLSILYRQPGETANV